MFSFFLSPFPEYSNHSPVIVVFDFKGADLIPLSVARLPGAFSFFFFFRFGWKGWMAREREREREKINQFISL